MAPEKAVAAAALLSVTLNGTAIAPPVCPVATPSCTEEAGTPSWFARAAVNDVCAEGVQSASDTPLRLIDADARYEDTETSGSLNALLLELLALLVAVVLQAEAMALRAAVRLKFVRLLLEGNPKVTVVDNVAVAGGGGTGGYARIPGGRGGGGDGKGNGGGGKGGYAATPGGRGGGGDGGGGPVHRRAATGATLTPCAPAAASAAAVAGEASAAAAAAAWTGRLAVDDETAETATIACTAGATAMPSPVTWSPEACRPAARLVLAPLA